MRHIRLVTGTWGISIAVLGFINAVCFSFEQRTSETHRETDFRSAKGMKYPFIDARLDPCERQSGDGSQRVSGNWNPGCFWMKCYSRRQIGNIDAEHERQIESDLLLDVLSASQ
jgi:hypothetical protein